MIIFVIVMGVLVILSSIKLIFGAVVYHAERTAGKQAKPIQQNKKS
ncbi:MAG: hypothetical protein MJ201_03410 [Mycoplasmoidaceae bacterium]|nr:hypothetical protein [Mycoplasmoidaceae bacterium]